MSEDAGMEITDRLEVGENDHGYKFAVGKLGGRWIGFADGDLGNSERGLFFFPGICEGYMLGITDRDRAIKLTGAIAQSFEHGYGGIARWFVPDKLRGRPEDFTCEHCGEVGCSGECRNRDFEMGFE